MEFTLSYVQMCVLGGLAAYGGACLVIHLFTAALQPLFRDWDERCQDQG